MATYGDRCNTDVNTDLSRIASSLSKYAKLPEEGHTLAPFGEHRQYVHEYTYIKYVYRRQFHWWDKWEDSVVNRLQNILNNRTLELHRRAVVKVLSAWRQVHSLGWGYVFKPLSHEEKGTLTETAVSKILEQSEGEGNLDGIWFCRIAKMGTPESVTDFHVIPKYAVFNESTGKMMRFVVLENMRGSRTETVCWEPSEFVSPERVRKWISEQGRFTFGVGGRAGIKELNMLQLDVNSLLELVTVTEYSRFGWQPLPSNLIPEDWDSGCAYGLWTFRDGMIFPDGQFVTPNKDGVVAWRGLKFRMGDCGPDGQGFKISRDPFWQPERTIGDLTYESGGVQKTMHAQLTERDHLRGFFVELTDRLSGTFGQNDWVMLLGGMLSYGVAPEVFTQNFQFPGAFVHGQAGSGKSYVVMWLMDLFGFDALTPLILRGGGLTEVGAEQAISQYSNIPVWADEYAVGEVSEKMQGVFRNAFGRGGVAKHGLGRDDRKPASMFLLSGENTSSDAAMRSRYVHIFISAHDRKAENRVWYSRHRKWFVLFWRYILTHRNEFVSFWRDAYATWLKWCEGSPCADSRAHFVYGVGWSAFEAMCRLLGALDASRLLALRRHVIENMIRHQSEVKDSTRSTVFWKDFLAAVDTRDIDLDWLDVEILEIAYPGQEYQQVIPGRLWRRAILYFIPARVRDGINAARRKRGEPAMMDISDLLAQLKPYPYFNHAPGTRRFGRHSKAGGVRCWGADLDLHELGYQKVADSTFHEWLNNTTKKTEDIRRGELYGLVDTWLHYRAEQAVSEQQSLV